MKNLPTPVGVVRYILMQNPNVGKNCKIMQNPKSKNPKSEIQIPKSKRPRLGLPYERTKTKPIQNLNLKSKSKKPKSKVQNPKSGFGILGSPTGNWLQFRHFPSAWPQGNLARGVRFQPQSIRFSGNRSFSGMWKSEAFSGFETASRMSMQWESYEHYSPMSIYIGFHLQHVR